MNRNGTAKSVFVYSTFLYVLGFFLFLEWLYPVEQITDTRNLPIFIVYAAFCFALSMFQIKWWLSFLLKGVAMLFVIHMLFMQGGLPGLAWLQQFFQEIVYNLQAFVNQDWYDLTPLFRSFLFLLLIWLMSYLLYYWFGLMNRIFLFVLLTIVYITVLDTFTVYEADGSIVRTFIFSLLAFGLANILKIMRRESIRFSWFKKSFVWLLPLIGVILFSTFIGYAAPKFESKWPDPVPFFKNSANGNGYSGDEAGVHKVGYGEDDSQLGGSFVQDHTPVFQASAKDEHYWRIETKDVYTGKGWERSGPAEYVAQNQQSLDLMTFDDSVETEEQRTSIEFQGNTDINKLLYPYGVREANTKKGVDLLLDQDSGEIRTQIGGGDASLQRYTLTFDKPSFAVDRLREQSTGDADAIIEQYTQVPDTLPDRVHDLAQEITSDKTSRYEKARAMERYFGQNGYTYETSDIPVPKGKEDYVDQFLFDSKKGYCDNYSTSMVVMLRTIGVPARWAKGFTSGEKIPGEYADGTGETYDIYEVTSSNAHSWVEVYFPGSGWVPFEPTQGFSNLGDLHENMKQQNGEDDKQEETEENENDEREPEQGDEQGGERDNETASDQEGSGSDASGSYLKWWFIGLVTVVILLIAVLGYLLRFRLKIAYQSMKLKRYRDQKTFQDAYHHLLELLKHKGVALGQGETLREFAERVDLFYDTDEMRMLTEHYEQMLYRNKVDEQAINNLIHRWEHLIKRIMA